MSKDNEQQQQLERQSGQIKMLMSKDKEQSQQIEQLSKWFEPRSISSSYCVIVRVRVVLKRTVVGD